ncbi:MAG: manganese efflux pump MntP family protein [Treponema sp.]|jgi:putative Mn2+ efflux pump MntP|nr:manganese efflux pump MntP family protein [Treponema sp.]
MLSIVLIGLSLSMDAFAVSVSSGISIRGLRVFHAVRASLLFGIFQFAMPAAGWFLGKTFSSYIQTFDHWIAFALLALIGGKMLWEAGQKAGQKNPKDGERKADTGADIRSLKILLTLALATSIDALAVGISFSILNHGIWGPAMLIGGITFAVCLTGFEFGRRIGPLFERSAQMLGGFILIGIGIKILVEHLSTA